MSNSRQNMNENSNHFEAFFEYATMGIVVTDSSGKITAINPFALKEFGYTKKELIGRRVEILIPARFHNSHVRHHEKYLEKPITRPMGNNLDLFAIKKDGTEFSVEISLSNYNINDDKFVICFVNNISIRKKALAEIERLNDKLETEVEQRTKDLNKTLEQLEKTNNKLEKAIALQKAMLSNAGVIIISSDKDGIIQTVNPEAEKELGYKADELVGKQSPLIFHDMTEVGKRAIELSKELGRAIAPDMEVFLAKSRLGLRNDHECTLIRKDRTRLPVLLTVNELKNNKDEIIGFLGIAINILKRKKAEEDLLESLKKEKELGELKSRFVTMASHEFRTPLSTVLSSAYLIEKYPATEDHPKREKHLQRIISSVNMLTDILNDFLSVGKIEEGKILVRPTQFNIREYIIAIVDEMKNSLQKQQKIKYHHEGNTEVLLDASLLKHIIMNLVSNAAKFSPETKPIEINTIKQQEQLILSVKDHGMGISKEDQQHLMERFFRGSNAGNIQGTGLGLHIVSKYAELMNGCVECKSELEKGTEFIITFKTKIC
jgi:PAS domain S-box-containing protein